jgi:hypothetical protein
MAKRIFSKPYKPLAKEERQPKRWCVLCDEWVTPLSDGKGCPCCWNYTMTREEKDASEKGL